MKRIMIIGGPGSGKSTLARQVGDRLNLSVTHLDAIYWKPGWVFSTPEEVTPKLMALYEQDEWVIEGNYSATWPERLARANGVVFLDTPTFVRFWRVLYRCFQSLGKVRPDMAEGCPEKLDIAFFRFVLGYRLRRRGKAIRFLQSAPDHVDTFHLATPSQTEAFLANLGKHT